MTVLPLPPSTNSLFPGTRRRHLSKEYTAWLAKAGEWFLLSPLGQQGAWPLERGVTVLWTLDMYVFMPNWRGDVDNRLKAPIDLLCTCTGLQDNRLVELHVQRITGLAEPLSGLVMQVGLA